MSAVRKAKRCTGCGLVQPLGAFDANPRARDGRRSHCKGCRRVQQRARGHPWARRRAQRWLARQYPDRWVAAFQARKRQARAELPASQAKRAHSRAWTRALADLQAAYPVEYAARYQVELAAYRQQHGYAQPSGELGLARARAGPRSGVGGAGRPVPGAGPAARPASARRPARRRPGADAGGGAAAGAGPALRALHPQQFQARYAAELARHAGEGQRL